MAAHPSVYRVRISSKYIKGIFQIDTRARYQDGSTAIQLYALDGTPELTATVCLPNDQPEPGNVIIKDWSENEGILNALRKAGVLEGECVRVIRCGHTQAYEYKLNPAFAQTS